MGEPAPASPAPLSLFDRPRLLLSLGLACALLSTFVFLRRGTAAWEAAHTAPGVAITSGYEEESIFALWRAAHGQPVYQDVTRLPYSSAYFNWLFYATYAVPAKLAVQLQGDAAIPVAGRLLTAAGTVAAVAGLGWLLRRIMGGQAVLAAALATTVFFGPLVAWWAHTLRPDLFALALEAAGLGVLLLGWRSRPMLATAAAMLLFHLSWAFKPTYLSGLAAAGIFLLFRRQWRAALLLAAGTVTLWTLTFLALGPEYRGALRGTATTNVFYLDLGLRHTVDMLAKTLPLWVLAAPALLFFRARNPVAAPSLVSDARALGLIGLGTSLLLAFVASCKLGASTYYFFPVPVMLALLAATAATLPGTRWWIAPGLMLVLGLQLAVLAGRAGKIDLREQTAELAQLWKIWANQPEPRFSEVTKFNLPWLSPGSPPLVTAFNYGLDRADARQFEAGGIGGLITAGRLHTLTLPDTSDPQYDGASLDGFVRGESLAGYTLFHRKP